MHNKHKKGDVIMAILSSFITMTLKALFLLILACAGVVCGKKLRDRNDAKKALESKES